MLESALASAVPLAGTSVPAAAWTVVLSGSLVQPSPRIFSLPECSQLPLPARSPARKVRRDPRVARDIVRNIRGGLHIDRSCAWKVRGGLTIDRSPVRERSSLSSRRSSHCPECSSRFSASTAPYPKRSNSRSRRLLHVLEYSRKTPPRVLVSPDCVIAICLTHSGRGNDPIRVRVDPSASRNVPRSRRQLRLTLRNIRREKTFTP
jgi:hypothetical protein